MAWYYASVTMLLQLLIVATIVEHRYLITALLANCSLQYSSPGDFNLGGIFSFYTNQQLPCQEQGGNLNPKGVFQAESLRFAVDLINNDPDLLPNITLGYHVVDDGWSEHVALGHTLNYMRDSVCTDECSNNESSEGDVVGIIGLSRSATTIPSARLAQLYEYPLVSYFASSEELADNSQFSYFLRTIPPDGLQGGAIVDLLETYNWNYIGLVHSIDSYGIHGARQLQLQMEKRGICIAFVSSVSDSATEKELGDVIDKFEEFPMAKTVVMFASGKVANTVLGMVKKTNLTREITWIGGDDWGFDLLNKGFEEITRGAVFTRFYTIIIPPYEEHVKSLKFDNPSLSPWIRAYWESNAATLGCTDIHSCNWYLFDDLSATYNTLSVVDAAYIYAHGLHSLLIEACGSDDIECQRGYAKRIDRKDLFRHLKNVEFKSFGGRFQFDDHNNPPGKYILRNWQFLEGSYQFTDVGLWQTTLDGHANGHANLTLNKERIQFRNGNEIPKSTCWPECSDGEIIVPLEKKCCFGCQNCQDKNYIVISETECDECPMGMWPNGNFSVCDPIVPTPISWINPIILVITIMSCLGLILVAVITGAMIVHREHRIIKASGRELNAINFVGITLCFLSAFVLPLPPTTATCIVVDALISLSFTLTYASTLLKVNRIFRIFQSAQKGVQRPGMVGPKDQLVMAAALIFVQVSTVRICFATVCNQCQWCIYNVYRLREFKAL